MAKVKERLPVEQEYLDWRDHPVTKAFLRMLEEYREDLKDQWEQGLMQAADPLETAIANASAIAKTRFIKEILELDYDEFLASFDHDAAEAPQSVGPTPGGTGGTRSGV